MIVGKLVAWAPVVGAPVVEQVIVDLLVLGQPVNRRSGFLPEVCQDRSFLCSTRFGFPVIAGWRFPGDRAGTGNAQGELPPVGVWQRLFLIYSICRTFFLPDLIFHGSILEGIVQMSVFRSWQGWVIGCGGGFLWNCRNLPFYLYTAGNNGGGLEFGNE